MNSQNTSKARTYLKDWPNLAPETAVMQLAALLALDYETAESIYLNLIGA